MTNNLLPAGTAAPDFELNCTPDQKIKLSDLKGKRVILAFYPADWSPVCGDQMALYNETLKFFHNKNAEILGISVDSKWCHMAFSQDRKLHFPLLADFEPKGEVSKLYGAYDTVEGESLRALYVLDEEGIIRWNFLSLTGMNPGADGILDALDEMDNKK